MDTYRPPRAENPTNATQSHLVADGDFLLPSSGARGTAGRRRVTKRSLHILADLYGCAGDPSYLTSTPKVRSRALAIIRGAGFRIVASRFHTFGRHSAGEGGITGAVIVSESHLTIHTWPEKRYVNLDVFFCNYTRDNSRKARAVFAGFVALYRPRRVRRREVWRD